MKILAIFMALALAASLGACGTKDPASTPPAPRQNAAPTPAPTPRNGDYPGKGRVIKINPGSPSIELKHEEIVGVMPAMQMEFFVIDKSILNGLAVGDEVDFTLRYKDGGETIVAIRKTK